MPLASGSSKKAIEKNIRECMHKGNHPMKQCVAMSFRKAGKTRRAKSM